MSKFLFCFLSAMDQETGATPADHGILNSPVYKTDQRNFIRNYSYLKAEVMDRQFYFRALTVRRPQLV